MSPPDDDDWGGPGPEEKKKEKTRSPWKVEEETEAEETKAEETAAEEDAGVPREDLEAESDAQAPESTSPSMVSSPSPSPTTATLAPTPTSTPTSTSTVTSRRRGGDRESLGNVISGKKMLLVFGIGAFFLLGAVSVVLSWMNSKGFYFVCQAKQIVAERGRWLPWGRAPMDGEEWKPIAKPPEARCTDRRFDTQRELAEALATALLSRANATLAAATESPITTEQLTATDAQLVQALLLLSGSEQSDQRKEIERLQGDVEYWRGAAAVREALAAMDKASEKFEAAASHAPRHAGDAQTWANHVRALAEELRQGPRALRPEAPSPPGTPPPFSGTGPTVAPPAVPPSSTDDAGDAVGRDTKTDAQPDAGPPSIPKGGVLL